MYNFTPVCYISIIKTTLTLQETQETFVHLGCGRSQDVRYFQCSDIFFRHSATFDIHKLYRCLQCNTSPCTTSSLSCSMKNLSNFKASLLYRFYHSICAKCTSPTRCWIHHRRCSSWNNT